MSGAQLARRDRPQIGPTGVLGLTLLVAIFALCGTEAAKAAEMLFASPQQGAQALAAAWRSDDKRALLAIFGPAGRPLVTSGDPVAEKEARKRLASAYDEAHRLEAEGPQKIVVVMGKEEWPYPIPLVKQGAYWRFDVKAGFEQILDRRVGRNELHAIETCRAYVAAQRDYAAQDRLGDGMHEFAAKIASSAGKHDGLYWDASAGAEESPLGPLVVDAEASGYPAPNARRQAPFHGYFYKILTRQGSNASGGAEDYVVQGHLTKGFALVAFPAIYGDSGVMTFIVSQQGIVFEKNLGPKTAEIARRMTTYDPDETWKPARP